MNPKQDWSHVEFLSPVASLKMHGIHAPIVLNQSVAFMFFTFLLTVQIVIVSNSAHFHQQLPSHDPSSESQNWPQGFTCLWLPGLIIAVHI